MRIDPQALKSRIASVVGESGGAKTYHGSGGIIPLRAV
jgi:hypothetical protein